MKRLVLLAAGFALATLPAQALEVSTQITLTLNGNAETNVVKYQCDGMDDLLEVTYVNANPTFLAFATVEGKKRVFVNVIAASGAKYVSGQYEWWTKGGEASLNSITSDEDGNPRPMTCTEAAETP